MSKLNFPKSQIRTVLVNLFKFGFAGGVIFWLWNSGKFDLKVILSILDPVYGPLIFSLVFAALFMSFFRLYMLLHYNGLNIPLILLLKTSLIGLFYNYALPGGTGGDVVKTYYLLQGRSNDRGKLITLVIADRIIGVIGILLMAFVALIFRPEVLKAQTDLKVLFFSLLAILIALFAVIVVLKKMRVAGKKDRSFFKIKISAEKIRELHKAAKYILNLNILFKVLSITLVSQTLTVLAMYFAGAFIFRDHPEINVELLPFFIVIPLGLLTTAVPISPGGIGVGQMAFYVLFKIYTDQSSELGPTVATIYQIIGLIIGISGLVLFLKWKRHPPRVDHNAI